MLIGDAVHAVTPHMGQGAAQGVEDGAVLADCLRATEDLEEAFTRYTERRYERCKLVVESSVAIGEYEMDPAGHPDFDQAGPGEPAQVREPPAAGDVGDRGGAVKQIGARPVEPELSHPSHRRHGEVLPERVVERPRAAPGGPRDDAERHRLGQVRLDVGERAAQVPRLAPEEHRKLAGDKRMIAADAKRLRAIAVRQQQLAGLLRGKRPDRMTMRHAERPVHQRQELTDVRGADQREPDSRVDGIASS